jgi:hypothetical protein
MHSILLQDHCTGMNPTTLAPCVAWPVAAAPAVASGRAPAGKTAASLTLELSAADLLHFRHELERARESVRSADDDELLDFAAEQLAALRRTQLPAFVAIRMERLEQMRAMLVDPAWHLEPAERELVLGVLAYVCDPEDLIPDELPGIGLLDDAIMIELACRELRHELEAYREFSARR